MIAWGNSDQYLRLIQDFVEGRISAAAFEDSFLRLFREHPPGSFGRHGAIIEGRMVSVDAFCADPKLRDSGDLDELELREVARKALMSW